MPQIKPEQSGKAREKIWVTIRNRDIVTVIQVYLVWVVGYIVWLFATLGPIH